MSFLIWLLIAIAIVIVVLTPFAWKEIKPYAQTAWLEGKRRGLRKRLSDLNEQIENLDRTGLKGTDKYADLVENRNKVRKLLSELS